MSETVEHVDPWYGEAFVNSLGSHRYDLWDVDEWCEIGPAMRYRDPRVGDRATGGGMPRLHALLWESLVAVVLVLVLFDLSSRRYLVFAAFCLSIPLVHLLLIEYVDNDRVLDGSIRRYPVGLGAYGPHLLEGLRSRGIQFEMSRQAYGSLDRAYVLALQGDLRGVAVVCGPWGDSTYVHVGRPSRGRRELEERLRGVLDEIYDDWRSRHPV